MSVQSQRVLPFLDLLALNQRFKEQFIDVTERVLCSGRFILGMYCLDFEKVFASYCGVAHGVGVGNGLESLQLILKALLELDRIKVGDGVIVPGNTFIATALAVTNNSLRLQLVEPDAESFNLDINEVEAAIDERTRVIIAVHLYGRLANMSALRELAERRGLLLIEDASQAHGASFEGRKAGSWGIAAGFSLFPGKPLGALGDAGVIVTDDPELAETVRALRNYGSYIKYQHEYLGSNSRLDELQAAFLLIKLDHLDADNREKANIAEIYCQGIKNNAISLPRTPSADEVHAWHIFTVRSTKRSALQAHLFKEGIETLVHYPLPIHKQPAYSEYNHLALPITVELSNQVLSLPIYPGLCESDIQRVVAACNSFIG
ncbi:MULTISPECIES: DegT/DnrJ/EryC1/StrS family aminotransferase [Pseudomonas]|uniref:dTDP-4-amino-4,6-dideoxygalactose transaminase n=1 Tax=Phytopseudomonas flavescens TaxID=29435 RepID=A0A7Z0BPC9_9GAMM|nr:MULTISPECIES: DegT/DnrJ/EryC1/StrS family aminotransferase [Pseudomonas]MCW2291624.1 dTDP-4-amino-4,6-dideoxygalactose transaminase [Pseudomonas sp. BIGb0408]NYH73805.1 dTDP-4-amino-4,6-dideoxygalactose transaminase [Pseudomonas flavescens]